LPGHILHGNRNTNRRAFRFSKSGVKYYALSQESKAYNLYYIAGVKYKKSRGDLVGIAAMNWNSMSAKARIKVNISKK